ncbi:MAG: PEP-utilizing enzyme [Actinomycetota bacterium]
MSERTATWDPPGPGEWEYDGSHSPPAPTPVFRHVSSRSAEEAYRWVFETYGGPLDTIEMRFVNGKTYRRLVPLVGADRGGSPPPGPILWAAARLHPAFRRRERTAKRTLEEGTFLEPIDHWDSTERQEWIDANRRLQAEPLDGLDDAAMADHVERVVAHNLAGWTRHHQLHGTDMGPLGDLLAHTGRWGLDPVAVMGLLQGRSPATVEAAGHAAAIAKAMLDAGRDPAAVDGLDDVRSVGGEVGRRLDAYLLDFGWRLVSSYDIEGLTVGELPGGTAAMIRSAGARLAAGFDGGGTTSTDPVETGERELRDRVPAADRADFDRLLDHARRAYGLRDDNGPLTAEWPMGLVRRAYLESGRRLAAGGRITEPDRVFELDGPELVALLRSGTGPTAAELDERAEHRRWEATLVAPDRLGPSFDPPSPGLLPPGLRRTVEAIEAAVSMLEPEPGDRQRLSGLGIGEAAVIGRARVATTPEDVLQTLGDGDILVAAWTAPTYNAVLAAVAGVVVQEGGLLCHAAVMARELGIPAVVGAAEAMTTIADGDRIEVDPVSGTVRVLEPAGWSASDGAS